MKAEQWALELVEDGLPIAAHPDMGRAFVEPVEGIGDGLVDAGGVAREPSDIDDGQLLDHLRPPSSLAFLHLHHGSIRPRHRRSSWGRRTSLAVMAASCRPSGSAAANDPNDRPVRPSTCRTGTW